MPTLKVVVEIEANGRYCNNLCQFMSHDAKQCELFDSDLVWNHQKKQNGNMRLDKCRKLEIDNGK